MHCNRDTVYYDCGSLYAFLFLDILQTFYYVLVIRILNVDVE